MFALIRDSGSSHKELLYLYDGAEEAADGLKTTQVGSFDRHYIVYVENLEDLQLELFGDA